MTDWTRLWIERLAPVGAGGIARCLYCTERAMIYSQAQMCQKHYDRAISSFRTHGEVMPTQEGEHG